MLAVVAGLLAMILVSGTSGPSGAQVTTPLWVQVSAVNATVNISVTNIAGSTIAIKRIDITRPGSVANHECGGLLPDGWTCTRPGATPTVVQFSTTGAGIAAGASASLQINITPPAGGGNQSFVVDSFESAGGANANTSNMNVNVSVDNDFPYVTLVNVSDGTNVVSGAAISNRSIFLSNTSAGLVFVINASDNASGMGTGNVTLYYNLSTLGTGNLNPLVIDYRNASLVNVSVITATNGSFGQTNLYNVSLNLRGMAAINGTKIGFIIVANDSVGNANVSNSSISVPVSTYIYNFTIDSVGPQFVDVEVSNGSQIRNITGDGSPNGLRQAVNFTGTSFGSGVEYFVNSSVFLNVTVLVRDDGGAGTVKVELMNRSGAFMDMALLVGTNGSTGQTSWVLNGSQSGANISGGNYNITDLVKAFGGDGKYNLTFRATDNVSNQNFTYNFTVEVDDSPPTASVSSNISINATNLLSASNASLGNATLNATAFVLRVETSNNINNVSANISVRSEAGGVFNMSYEGGTPSGTSRWNLTIANGTTANLSQFCAGNLAGDGTSCSFRFNFSDSMGRYNDTINLTVYIDSITPAVTNISLSPLRINLSTIALINVSVNDTIGPIRNASFRLRIASGIDEGGYSDTQVNITVNKYVTNVTNWIPMSLGTGSNAPIGTNGTWNFTLNLTALNFTDGNYSIEFNVTDSAGRQNVTVSVANIYFDSTRPYNISILSPASNSFHRSNVTFSGRSAVNISAVANESSHQITGGNQSGLLNVSFRLENNTHAWPWVEVNTWTVFTSLANGGFFSPSPVNFTDWGGQAINATNGNFTIRLNVTDTAGNQNTTVIINLTIDNTVPFGISIGFPGNNQNQSANFTLNVSVLNESNINTVQFRWENGSYVDANSIGGNVSDWINMNSIESQNNSRWNATFNLTEGTAADGNYSIVLNVTDKAGNSNTSTFNNINSSAFIQLLLDRSRPEAVAVGSLANSQQTDDFVINMTTRDNRTWSQLIGLINSTNINATAFRLENRTHNLSYQNLTFLTTNLALTNDSNATNATFEFTSVANGNYDIRFWVNYTAGNQNTSVLITNITLQHSRNPDIFSQQRHASHHRGRRH